MVSHEMRGSENEIIILRYLTGWVALDLELLADLRVLSGVHRCQRPIHLRRMVRQPITASTSKPFKRPQTKN